MSIHINKEVIRIHELKCVQPFFNDIVYDQKTFDLRVFDRDYQIGDYLLLKEFSNQNGYTENSYLVKVQYIFLDPKYGIKKGFCILGISKTYLNKIRVKDKKNGRLGYASNAKGKAMVDWDGLKNTKYSVRCDSFELLNIESKIFCDRWYDVQILKPNSSMDENNQVIRVVDSKIECLHTIYLLLEKHEPNWYLKKHYKIIKEALLKGGIDIEEHLKIDYHKISKK